ncbi:RNA polymerase sigma factor [Patulibacter medicamentivorans]|uniref:RNA polymerase sigma factor n=1 Tax=Patulibacter medicamentivorans TaxID=1097667 RepID=UPI00068343A0|nr:RNA polymerase sigma factor [Patulibacter medicamentivorans]
MARKDSDARLLSAGDRISFETFYVRHVDTVLAYVSRRVSQPDVAFDVVAETFARALDRRTQYRSRRGPAVAWLLTIARNVLIDAQRRGRVADDTRQRLQMQPVVLEDEELREIEERSAAPLSEALQRLPAAQREAVERRVLQEEPYATIATSLKCSEQVVRQRVRRGLAALREDYQEEQR